MLYLDDMADIGCRKTIDLLYLFYGIVILIIHKVGSAKFRQMGLGVVGTPIFSFGGYLMAVGVGSKGGWFHTELLFHLISQKPVGNLAYIYCHTEILVNVFLAVVVFACNAADGNGVAFGSCSCAIVNDDA